MKVTRPVQIEHLVLTPGARHDLLRASAAGASSTKAQSANSSRRIHTVNTARRRSMRSTVSGSVGEAVERDPPEALQTDHVARVVEDPLALAPVLGQARVGARAALD